MSPRTAGGFFRPRRWALLLLLIAGFAVVSDLLLPSGFAHSQFGHLVPEPGLFQRGADEQDHLVHFERLGHVFERAVAHGLHSRARVRMRGHDDAFQARALLAGPP